MAVVEKLVVKVTHWNGHAQTDVTLETSPQVGEEVPVLIRRIRTQILMGLPPDEENVSTEDTRGTSVNNTITPEDWGIIKEGGQHK